MHHKFKVGDKAIYNGGPRMGHKGWCSFFRSENCKVIIASTTWNGYHIYCSVCSSHMASQLGVVPEESTIVFTAWESELSPVSNHEIIDGILNYKT